MKKLYILIPLILAAFILFSCTGNEAPVTGNETASVATEGTSAGTAEHVHSFGDWETVKTGNCTIDGKRQRVCSCGETESEIISAPGHKEVEDKPKAPTCDEEGLSAGRHCEVCKKVTVTQKSVPAKGHSYGAWNVSDKAHTRACNTCGKKEDGSHTLLADGGFCSVCKAVFKEDYTIPTPAAGMTPKVEDLGNLTKTIYIRMNGGGYRKDGTPVLYFVTDGKPYALFVMMDALTGEILLERELKKSTGAWESFVHSSGDVFIVGHGSPYFYKFDHETERITEISSLPHGSSMGQVMCETKDGYLFSGSTDTNRFWGYDPAKDRFIGIPALVPNATRYPAVAYDEKEDKIYVSVISKDSKNYLFKVDPHTKEAVDVTPEKYRNDASFQFYDMIVFGDILFIRYPSTLKTIFLNIRTNELVTFNKEGETGGTGELITYCRQPARDPENSKRFYSIMENKIALFDTETLTYKVTNTDAPNNYMIRMVMLKLNSDKYTGYSACSIYSHKGKIQFSNFDTGESVILDTNVSGSPNDANCLAVTDDGKLVVGGNFGGSTGIYDIVTGEKTTFEGISQQEGMTAYKNKVYVGSYPEARIRSLIPDLKAPVHKLLLTMAKNNEIEDYDNQDRPYNFLSIYEKELLVAATIPAQNFTTGAIAIFDAKTDTLKYTCKFPVEHQSAASLAYSNGKLYMGTTVRVGYGTANKTSRAKFVEMDLDDHSVKVYDLPAASAAVTALVTDNDGKIWGMASNTMFCFDPKTSKFIYSEKISVSASNGDWRNLRMTLGGDGSCILISSSSSRAFYRFDLTSKKVDILAENVGWNHVADKFGNFYFISGMNVKKLSFEY